MLTPQKRLQLAPATAGFVLSGTLLFAASTQAYEFEAMDGEVQGTLNTTITLGAKYDLEGYETPDGSEKNENDGDRSFDKGFVSKALKLTSELDLKKDNYGFYGRATAFYDHVLMNGSNKWESNNAKDVAKGFDDETGTFNGWSDEVKDNQGRGAKLQSAYLYGDWTFEGGQKLSLKLGDQTHNWGESIFYAGGLRDLNAYDVALSSLPGSDGDLNIAQGMLMADLQFNDEMKLSAFAQYDWERSIMLGRGTYGSGSDLFVPGSDFAYYELSDFGLKGQDAVLEQAGILQAADYGKVANVGGVEAAKDSGQWGVKFTFTPEALPDTEFALYYANYHSSLPFFEARVSQSEAARGIGLVGGIDPTTGAFDIASTSAGAIRELLSAASGAAAPNNLSPQAQGLAGGIATLNMLANGVDARVIYPEDIKLWGASFNTKVWGYTQIAGEITYRENAPIWLDHPDDILGSASAALGNIANGLDFVVSEATETKTGTDQWYQNIERVPMWDASLSVIQPFGAVLGTDLMYVVAEAAFEQVAGLNDKYYGRILGKGAESGIDAEERLDRNSWGYNVMVGANWNDVAMQGLNLESTFRFTHDVNGNSHFSGRFEEGEKRINMGLTAKYDDMMAKVTWGGDADNVLRKGTITGTVGYTF
ncbi:DUF1302 family protein [Thalassotalea sp. G20_0]|uniref:DUF1302 domain-containing protein n=1 Tax=Thalassotalea sp. G20_0 TaxID=2821093 RepID=UPI001ADAA183|nr:DUF1302 family protein [Thalassotalea sp. G20_0]MBO9495844.1 DUF1302 family protein [Thalassotalea sp. G20_0]